MKYVFAFVATCAAVIVAYVVYANERQNTDMEPIRRFLEDDEFLAHLPHPWSKTS